MNQRNVRMLVLVAAGALAPAAIAQSTDPGATPEAKSAAAAAGGFIDKDNQPAAPPNDADAQPADAQDAGTQNSVEAQAAEADAQANAAAGSRTIARWLRSIGGRICLGPKLDHFTVVSRPNPADTAQGWRVSIPTFALARVSAPPKRATPIPHTDEATALAEGAETTEATTEQASVEIEQ